MATRGRERLLLDCDQGDLFPRGGPAPGPERAGEAALGPGFIFWEGRVAFPSLSLYKIMIAVFPWRVCAQKCPTLRPHQAPLSMGFYR